jgi:squalene-hopene/tetraprenyl-beta-curcumene cyclase
MANSVMMYDALGYSADHPDYATARRSIDKLLVVRDDEAYCQPCAPVWDTALAARPAGVEGELPPRCADCAG